MTTNAILKTRIAELEAKLAQQRERYQEVIRDVTATADRVREVTGQLPLMLESTQAAMHVLKAMSGGMDNRVLAEMLRNLAGEFRRQNEFYGPRMASLRAALDELEELKGQRIGIPYD